MIIWGVRKTVLFSFVFLDEMAKKEDAGLPFRTRDERYDKAVIKMETGRLIVLNM